MEMNGRDWLLAIIWLCLGLTVEAVTQQAISNNSPLDSTTQFVGQGTSFWGITSSASSWYIYFWLKWDDPARAASLMDFFVGSQAMYITEERDTGNLYTSAGSVSGLQVSGYWVFVAHFTEGSSTKTMVKRWARSATTQSGLASLSLNPSTAYIKIPNESTFAYHVILTQYKLVNMVFSTDSVSSATITSAMNSGECFSTCSNHCSAPILTSAYCNCDGTCSLCYDAGFFQCATCPSGNPLGTGNCVSCHSYCATCSGSTSATCLTCKSNASLPPAVSPGACSCDSGYYGNPDACAKCDSTCKSCSASGTSSCTECNANASLPTGLSTGACTCSDGYFGSASNCQRCNAMCKTCNAASCTSCFDHAHDSSGACVCDNEYYPSTDASNCVSCDVTCLSCSAGGASSCKTCRSHASVSSPPGACICDPGYYGSANNCLPCDSTCKACTSGGSSGCTECQSHAELPNSPGQCVCVPGYFPNTTSAACAPCDSTCLQCAAVGADQCTLCRSNAHLDSNPGTCTCDDGYFPDTTSSNCSPCTETCRKCSGLGVSKCTSCRTGAELRSNMCYCLQGYYLVTYQGLCGACHPTCQSCSGSGQNQCLTCKPNSTKTYMGACECNAHNFFDAVTSQCQPCDSSCTSCLAAGPNGCNGCPAPLTLRQACSCDGGVPACSRCDCSGCTSNGCVVCHPPAVLPLGSGMGVCVCSDGYYFSEGSCKVCDSTCSSCTASECTVCWPNAYLTPLGKCMCAAKYYPSPDASSCRQCHSTCTETCFGSDAKDCIPQAASDFIQAAKGFSLPFLTVNSGLICYRTPVPTGIALVRFLQVTGLQSTVSSTWALTLLQCNRFLASVWSAHNADFHRLFNGLALPTFKQQQATAILRLWVMHFGNALLTVDPTWRLLLSTLSQVRDWTTIAGFPTNYFDGIIVRQLPNSLRVWISSGHTDFEVFNYWNNIAAVCFSGSCAAGDADICCGRAMSCPSACCVAFPAKQASCSSL